MNKTTKISSSVNPRGMPGDPAPKYPIALSQYPHPHRPRVDQPQDCKRHIGGSRLDKDKAHPMDRPGRAFK